MLYLIGLIILCGIWMYYPSIKRAYKIISLFWPSKIVQNFRSMDDQGFPSKKVHKGKSNPFLQGGQHQLPPTFIGYDGSIHNTISFLNDHWTTGLVVLKIENETKATILYEQYFRGNDKDSCVISWSTAKSLISALIGIALKEGQIHSVYDYVTMYVPELKNSGYQEVTIKNVLQMASGVSFNENYFDPLSDINRLGYLLSFGGSLDAFISSLVTERSQGTYHNYISADTQVLAMVLKRATGMTISEYTEKKLWHRLGAESDAYWILDNEINQTEIAFGGFNACTRDFARIGWLYFNNGVSPVDGSQIIDESYIKDSITPDGPHLQPGERQSSEEIMGYGYQWWLLGKENHPKELDEDYLAIGVYNQFIYVHPRLKIVIARNSAYPYYDQNTEESERNAISCFRAMADHFSQI